MGCFIFGDNAAARDDEMHMRVIVEHSSMRMQNTRHAEVWNNALDHDWKKSTWHFGECAKIVATKVCSSVYLDTCPPNVQSDE